jgi:rare lipoprotein A
MDRSAPARLGRFLLFSSVLMAFGAFPARAGQPRSGARHPAPQVTRASWYGKAFQGRRTAGGTVFDPQRLTAAHRTLRMGSRVRVTELKSGRSVVVEITDRGPYLQGRGIDLSYAAARKLGIVRRGVARVQVELLETDPRTSAPPIVTASAGPTWWWLPRAIVR